MEKRDMTDVIARCLEGDECAQEELILAVQNRVYFHCRKMIKHEEDAQDLTQEVLIAMLTNLDKLKRPESFWTWLGGITANLCRNAVNRGHKELQIPEDEEGNNLLDSYEDLDEQKVPDKALDNDETQRMIEELIDALPSAQRECVLLYYYEEMSVKEIAAALNTSEGTIKSRLNYARKTIKEGVEGYEKQGIKLYGLSPLPFLLYFLKKSAVVGGLTPLDAAAVAQSVLSSSATAQAAAAAGGVTAGAACGAKGAATTGSAASKAAAGIMAHKGIAAAVAGVVLTGAVAGGALLHKPQEEAGIQLTLQNHVMAFEVSLHSIQVIGRNTDRHEPIPYEEITWEIEDPNLISIDPATGVVSAHATAGTTLITASWNGYTGSARFEVVPGEQLLCLDMMGVSAPVGADTSQLERGRITLDKESTDQLGTAYAVEWKADDPALVSLIPHVSDDGVHSVTFDALAPGDTFITCTATWPDGRTAHQVCDVHIYK